MFQLLLSAYSTISIYDAALFLGMSEDVVTNYVLEHGWSVDPASRMLTVKKQTIVSEQKLDPSKLQRLTEYVELALSSPVESTKISLLFGFEDRYSLVNRDEGSQLGGENWANTLKVGNSYALTARCRWRLPKDHRLACVLPKTPLILTLAWAQVLSFDLAHHDHDHNCNHDPEANPLHFLTPFEQESSMQIPGKKHRAPLNRENFTGKRRHPDLSTLLPLILPSYDTPPQ
ncbi:CSN8/PSMD8/EIF3K [Dillenia turbinata]|uniref:CSN8/PSMD8/EIF3K n=1 Tax=Dillenia turbinata TaxID=194707 RepID=A0AAN8VX20_9MAGN